MSDPVITVEEFIQLHPQFSQSGSTLIASAIARATSEVSECVFGDSYVTAVEMKACHYLAIEMYGQQASLKGDETTVYETKFKALLKMKAFGMTVA